MQKGKNTEGGQQERGKTKWSNFFFWLIFNWKTNNFSMLESCKSVISNSFIQKVFGLIPICQVAIVVKKSSFMFGSWITLMVLISTANIDYSQYVLTSNKNTIISVDKTRKLYFNWWNSLCVTISVSIGLKIKVVKNSVESFYFFLSINDQIATIWIWLNNVRSNLMDYSEIQLSWDEMKRTFLK